MKDQVVEKSLTASKNGNFKRFLGFEGWGIRLKDCFAVSLWSAYPNLPKLASDHFLGGVYEKKDYRLQGPSIRANDQKMSTGSSKNASACFQCLLIVPIFCSSPVATGSTFCCLNTTVSHSIVSLQCLNSQHVKPPFLFQPIIAITSISLPPDNKVCLIGEKKYKSLYWWFLKPNGFVWEQDAPKICYGHQFFRVSPIFRRARTGKRQCHA